MDQVEVKARPWHKHWYYVVTGKKNGRKVERFVSKAVAMHKIEGLRKVGLHYEFFRCRRRPIVHAFKHLFKRLWQGLVLGCREFKEEIRGTFV